MIVCSCNALSDRHVRTHLANAPIMPRTVRDTFRSCGKTPGCGRCARTLRCLLRDALAERAGDAAQVNTEAQRSAA